MSQKKERPEPVMNIHITFRHTEPTDAIRDYAVERIFSSLVKYLRNANDVHVILSVEKRDQNAEIIIRGRDGKLSAEATTSDLYASIDKAALILSKQLKRKREKIRYVRDHPISIAA